jgi:hypothetical protein
VLFCYYICESIEQIVTNATDAMPNDINTCRHLLHNTEDIYFMYAPIINNDCNIGKAQSIIIKNCKNIEKLPREITSVPPYSTKIENTNTKDTNNDNITIKKLNEEKR